MRKHEKFILTPITSVLDEGCTAMAFLDDGLEIYPVSEYMMQSLFLKITGFQEQKVKCILWELATDNYELRYERFKRKPINEASSYEDKQKVFNDLAEAIETLSDKSISLLTDVEQEEIVDKTFSYMENFSKQRFLRGWSHRQYSEFKQLFANCGKECLLFHNNHKLFSHCNNCKKKSKAKDEHLCKKASLEQVYEKVYKHRNRCAHNTASYQQNLPSLDVLEGSDYVFENYFVRFTMLIIIDKMFVKLFEKYLDLMQNSLVL
ncbi:hypothetical protein [Bacteroides pyogenes]|uniref:hypothetical protein n=1 Tax=Bacteroides pyogenes TaxID=310300 RepID=UPI0011E413D1|nr:hypothetical protein [Bacteroides pyogenes]TYK37830.1 hypothetical protein FNJ61_06350 [Bacteroides pyogenes]